MVGLKLSPQYLDQLALTYREFWRIPTGGDELNAICIEEAFCWQVVGKIIDVDDKQHRVYGRALRDTTYGLSHLR